MFDATKPARVKATKQEVKFLARVENSMYPLVYLVKVGGEEVPYSYTKDGQAHWMHPNSVDDLENIREKIEGWVNFHRMPSGDGVFASSVHSSKSEANYNSCSNRVACVFVSFYEGEGLERTGEKEEGVTSCKSNS